MAGVFFRSHRSDADERDSHELLKRVLYGRGGRGQYLGRGVFELLPTGLPDFGCHHLRRHGANHWPHFVPAGEGEAVDSYFGPDFVDQHAFVVAGAGRAGLDSGRLGVFQLLLILRDWLHRIWNEPHAPGAIVHER